MLTKLHVNTSKHTQMLNITEAAVSGRLQKAKQKLRQELEGGEGDDR